MCNNTVANQIPHTPVFHALTLAHFRVHCKSKMHICVCFSVVNKNGGAIMYNLYQIIESLCDSRGITIGQLSKEIGLHRNTIPRLKTKPDKDLSRKTLQKISSYFGVPTDYFSPKGEPDQLDIPPEPEISDNQLIFALWGKNPHCQMP